MSLRLVITLVCVLLFVPGITHASQNFSLLKDGTQTTAEFGLPFESVGGVVSADLGIDGVREIIVAAGRSEEPIISIMRQDGSHIFDFLAYAPHMDRGVTVAVGDVTGDSSANIVTGTMYGAGPHIRVFDGHGNLSSQFFGYDENFKGGVNVTLADINGDGIDEIITAAGMTGGPHVRAFDKNGNIISQFFAFDPTDNAGITIAKLDDNQDGRDELAIAHFGRSATEARIVRFDNDNTVSLEAPFPLYNPSYISGVTLFNINDLVFGVSPNGNGGPHVRAFNSSGKATFNWFAFEPEDNSRVITASNGPGEMFSVASNPLVSERTESYIYVNLDEQHLYAYENGIAIKDFPISGGKWPWKTPTGEFNVFRKLRVHDYSWFFGDGDPRNYDLPDVEYNLNFHPRYYIHHAYWHDNFGNPMSHGCVNAPYEGVKWLYEWAPVGITVVIE